LNVYIAAPKFSSSEPVAGHRLLSRPCPAPRAGDGAAGCGHSQQI